MVIINYLPYIYKYTI